MESEMEQINRRVEVLQGFDDTVSFMFMLSWMNNEILLLRLLQKEALRFAIIAAEGARNIQDMARVVRFQ
jgi:hypothetical protein